jgi:RNA polymerase sigma-70 factor (sigma-B/F/G subfamily)
VFNPSVLARHADFAAEHSTHGANGAEGALKADGSINSRDRAARTAELLARAATADPADAEQLYEQVVLLNVEIAESIVLRYRNRGVPVEDLVQVACVGLVKAARGFDVDKSSNFLSYAVPTILGEVKRFFRDNAWVVKPPRRVQELQAQISAASARMTHTSGAAPTPEAIAGELGVERAQVEEALAADGCYSPSSLDRTMTSGDEDGAQLGDLIGSEDLGFDRAEALVALRPLCRQLSERDRRIVYLRFFCEWTQARIAAEFGVTQMQISRLLSRILTRLRDDLGTPDEPVVRGAA